MKSSLKKIFKGASGDSFFLMFVRLVTLVFGMVMTRVLSEHFSLQEYGTYSQILLLTSTISSMTILGMMDGVNFFFCKEKDEQKRKSYVSTIFALQYFISVIVSITVIACAIPISHYFDNETLKSLVVFAAILPVLQNSISLLQILFIAIGKAKLIAIRNLVVSIFKLIVIMLVCYVFDNIVILLVCQVLLDIAQVFYFYIVLKNNNCRINVFRPNILLIKEILLYCIPMAMFTIIKSLNRDADKFVISYFANTEILAVYTNASKLLPFDIVMSSFCTVLIPYITRYISEQKYERTQILYKTFLEISYISTTILAIGAVCVSPEVIKFLYSDKYLAYGFSIPVFIIYTIVDIVNVFNITLILSSSGKTKSIMFISMGTFVLNIVLNIILFYVFAEVGPALATLLVAFIQGIVILIVSAKTIKTSITKFFDIKYLLFFVVQIMFVFVIIASLRQVMVENNIYYLITLIVSFGLFIGILLLFNLKRIFKDLKIINECKIV